jgi:DNA-binding IscR family transcriptional regulator
MPQKSASPTSSAVSTARWRLLPVRARPRIGHARNVRDVRTCELRATLIEARDATAAILERTTLAQVSQNTKFTKANAMLIK